MLQPIWVNSTAWYGEWSYLYWSIQFRNFTALSRVRHFARDQRLRLETPGWRAFDFDVKLFTEDELERQRDKLRRVPSVVGDKEYPFQEDLIPEASGKADPQPPQLAKVSSLVNVLQQGETYELIERLSERFVSKASPLPGRTMRLWLVSCFVRNIWADSLSHSWSFICFSQPFSMEGFRVFSIVLLSGLRHISSLALILKGQKSSLLV